jgi:hypothetical protein
MPFEKLVQVGLARRNPPEGLDFNPLFPAEPAPADWGMSASTV